jgi:hypothetical protein
MARTSLHRHHRRRSPAENRPLQVGELVPDLLARYGLSLPEDSSIEDVPAERDRVATEKSTGPSGRSLPLFDSLPADGTYERA